jgi:thiol-disulfide isomerase/thioredoxin
VAESAAQKHDRAEHAWTHDGASTRCRPEDGRRAATAHRIGAAIEGRAQAGCARQLPEAVYSCAAGRRRKDTSIIQRINKNINPLSLEGRAGIRGPSETPGGPSPTLASLKGKPVVLFFWAHWCPDCKAMSPILDEMRQRYADTGLTIVSPTQRYGYVAKRAPASPEQELAYIKQIRQESYPWMVDNTVPVSGELFTRYGVSTTPTLVFINRDGTVKLYHPGQMTKEQIEPVIRSLVSPAGSAH